MNKAFVHVMVDATWIWDSVLCRMDWANKEGLEFIGISNLNDLQKVRYNDDLPWVYQLNELSKTDLPLKGVMEKISFPNDVVLNCWVKNHEVQEGHPGLWIILKEDQAIAPSNPLVEKKAEKEVEEKVAEIETLAEPFESKPFELVKPESKKRDVVTPAFSTRDQKTFDKSDVEISLKPTTLMHAPLEHKSEAEISKKSSEQVAGQEEKITEGEERRDSTKILALIARQINAKTGRAPFKKKTSSDAKEPVQNENHEKNVVSHHAVSRNVSDYVRAETPKDVVKPSSVSSIEDSFVSLEPENENSTSEQSKVSLPGMAELIKQMRQSDGLKSDGVQAVDQDISRTEDHGFEEDKQPPKKDIPQVENMPIAEQGKEVTKPVIQSVSNSEGIPDTKMTSTSEDRVEALVKSASGSKEEGLKYADTSKEELNGLEQGAELPAPSEAASEELKPEASEETLERNNNIRSGETSEFRQRSMYDFPVASAMANEKGRFVAASELFSLAMGYHDEDEFLEEAQFEKILPHIFTALIKEGDDTRSQTNFFENSAGLTKSGRKMKLSLSAKSVKTAQGMTHFMILYPTGVDVPVISHEPVKAKMKQDSADLQGLEGRVNLPLLSSDEVEAKEENGLKDEYERTLPFLAKISHEIRTPLNSIIGFSEIMKEEQFGPVKNERYLGYMDDIFVSANHALSLVNDMLDISRIQAGSMDVEPEDLDLNADVQSAIKSMAPQFASKDIHVWQGLSDKKLSVKCDKRSLRQIVLNLVSNAIKYTPEGGQITITTASEKNGQVVFRVRDTGIGMSDSDIKQAMKPFQRLDTILKHETNGSGLGLPLTKALIEANQATFKIESAVDKGTVASVLFSK